MMHRLKTTGNYRNYKGKLRKLTNNNINDETYLGHDKIKNGLNMTLGEEIKI